MIVFQCDHTGCNKRAEGYRIPGIYAQISDILPSKWSIRGRGARFEVFCGDHA